MSSTQLHSRAHRHALRDSRWHRAHSLLGSLLPSFSGLSAVTPLASTGCGAVGTIADQSGFEGADGNLSVTKAGCMDWNGFAPVTWNGSVPYQNATKTSGNYAFFGVSDAFATTDTQYGSGVKQADECPATDTGPVDNKTDIARIYVAASTDPVTKHVFLQLAWIRAPQNNTSSDVHIGFEFNQGKTACGSGSTLVHRMPGDILLVYNFQSGSASIAYAEWSTAGGTGHWTSEVTLAANVAEASVFEGTSTADAIKPSNGIDPATDEFGEAGIDLTAATSGLGSDGRACEQFGTTFGESRTSGSSTSAQMKDIVGPANINVSNCATPTLTTTQQPASAVVGTTFKDKATISGLNSPDGTGSITFKLYSAADCGGSVLDTETVTGISANGDYTTPTGFQLNDAGTYYWVASFSGDGYNNTKTNGCNDEPVTVLKASSSIVTTQQPASGAIGITYGDKATLSSGGNFKGTGSITFKLYGAADCGGSVLDTETVSSIAANGDYTTPNGFAIQNAGTYYWVASFSGDANNNSFTSACNDEPVVVAKNQPSISTTQQPAAGAIGDLYKDKATLSAGVNYDGTGAITFKLYSAAGCGGSVLDTESVTAIAANGDSTTPTGFHIANAGTYYWVASFGGDSNNKSFTSACNDEPVVVAKNQPSISTTQQPASGAIGDLFKDKATLSAGVNYAGTGAITFKLYSAADCGGSVLDTESVTAIAANGDYTTPTGFHIANAGTYYWVASFNGDANNKSFTSDCNDEPVVVGKNQPSIATTQQPASGAIGVTFKDKATLSGGANLKGTGSINFKLYSAADCGGSVLDDENVTAIAANGDYTTPNGFAIQNAGTYYWVASFNGDANNKSFTSDCNDEPVVVGKNSPSIVTTQQPASGAIGVTFKDKATLSAGVNYDGSGSVNFKLYSAANCGGSVLDNEDVSAIAANGAYTTPNGFVIQNAGTYYWVASFNGDSNNKSYTSPCNDEPVVVAQNQPSIVTTQQPASGLIGQTYKDKATLSAGVNYDGTGSINFKLYSAAGCGGSVLDDETVTAISANGDVTTPDGFAIQNAGTYYWVASFSGDANNKSFTSACNDEPVVVAKNSPSIVTTQQPASGAIGVTFKDKATLSGGVNYAGTGSVNFKLYSAANCGGSVLDNENVTAIAANADYTTPNGFAIQNAGTYYWVASFNGDTNNKSYTSPCNDEPVVVAQNQPSIHTTQLPEAGAIGDLYKDKATLSAGVNYAGTGSITFKLYSAADCGGQVLDTETVNSISANGDYATPTGFHIPNAGTYYWVASFSGDANNKSFTSDCNDEPVGVGKNRPSISTTQQPAAGPIGDLYKDKATLSAGVNYDGTGSISFKLYSAADCGGSVLDTESVTAIAANGAYTTPTGFHIANAGTYYWVASFKGDANNAPFTSPCNDEPVVVGKNSPSIVTTQQPASGAIGDLFKDKATLSAGVNYDGTGSITFKLYSAADCGGAVLDSESVDTIAANGDYTTPDGFQLDNAGTYYWVASFNGDANNKSFTSSCNDEPVVVAKNGPSIVTTQQPASGSVADTFNDQATLSGGVNYDGTGSINFKLYSAADCGGSVLADETVDSISANGDYPSPNGVQLNTAGTYYWVASFSGDANNKAYTSPCNEEPVVVKPASIKIVKTADQTQVNAGDQIGFTLTVSNSGSGDAYGVNLSDVLPANDGLAWTIKSQGDGWAGSCSIDLGTLQCGPVKVPAGTTQLESTFTVHIISPTTKETAADPCPEAGGNVNNSGHVSTSNDGSDDSSAYVCVNTASIHIVKTADAAQVNAGDQIGFSLTVSNSGSGDAYGVNLKDVLPTNDGLAWTIKSQGDGWGNGASQCAIADGTLECGPVTVPAGLTQADSTFTVHIISPTTKETAAESCPEAGGNVNNSGHVSTSNDGSDDSSAYVCVNTASIHIVKTADQTQVNAGDQIGFTLTVSNSGSGDAYGVNVSDVLPANDGLVWTIKSQGDGWGNGASQCSIDLGTLKCGPVKVPAGTTQAESTFTVHIISPTTKETAADPCPEAGGNVNNSGHVSTSNDGSDDSSAYVCVNTASIHIVKTADAVQVNQGTEIGFAMTVYNDGSGDAYGVKLNDPLPAHDGLAWKIKTQGDGWGGSCAIAGGKTLECGPVTVPAGTTKDASKFTVHITSTTGAGSGGLCPETGVVDNTGFVKTTNDGSDNSEAKTCIEGVTDLKITKTGSPASQDQAPPYQNITWTITVTNLGPDADTGVKVGDPLPAGNTYVTSSMDPVVGLCSVTAGTLNCDLGTMKAGDKVTITLVTHPTLTGEQVNTAEVTGDLPESDVTNNQATATVLVNGLSTPPCTAVFVKPDQLYAGRATKMHIKVMEGHTAVRGVRVLIKGPGLHIKTKASNKKGNITQTVKPKKAGIMTFRPIVTGTACKVPRVGITGVFTPPVTG